ncbi:MAG: tetratricopeptide repeat protein [Acidobacteriota bacterium]|nr:MAG: tetratricopeptide repeat protein [Acidobacteriota bacterium]
MLSRKLSIRSIVILLLTGFALLFMISPAKGFQRRKSEVATVLITGRILDEAGEPFEELIQVNVVCSGRHRLQTLTDQNGVFTFDLSEGRTEDWLDPSAGGSVGGTPESSVKVRSPGGGGALDAVPSMGRGRVNLSGCEVRVEPQPGKTSNVIPLGTLNTFENPDIGVIVIREMTSAEVATVSISHLGAPEKAVEAFNKADEELKKPKPNLKKAAKELEKATKEYPEYAAAWDLLARVHLSQGRSQEGRQAFIQATQTEPEFITPYLGLAQIAVQESNWLETRDWTEKAIEIDEQQHQALYWNGMAHYYLNEFGRAEEVLGQVYEAGHAETYPFGLLLLGVIHANQGKIRNAASELRQYLDLMPADQVPEAQRLQLEQQLAQWKSEGIG